MTNKKHSRLCLRRMSSRASLAPTDQHSRFCVKSRLRRISIRIHTIISPPTPFQHRQDYFTRVLPPEIRLLIYEYVLAFDSPITLQRNAEQGRKLIKPSILLANRLIYKEALPVLYELNTIAIPREEYCHYPTGKRGQLTCSHDLIQHLYISDLALSERCAATISSSTPANQRPCKNCSPCISWLINTLRLKPRLKTVSINYRGYYNILSGHIEALKQDSDMSQKLQIVCTGIGRYKLTGSFIGRVQFELQDVPLVQVWSRVTALPSLQPFGPYLREMVRMHRDLKWILQRIGRRDFRTLRTNIEFLMDEHDRGLIPSNFASIWPPDVTMDLRCLSRLDRPDFLHQINVRLQPYLEHQPSIRRDMVVRRA